MFFCTSEIFLIENQQSATDYIRGPCLFVDSKEDGSHIKVTGCNSTNERQNWAYTLKGQIMVSLCDLHAVNLLIARSGSKTTEESQMSYYITDG